MNEKILFECIIGVAAILAAVIIWFRLAESDGNKAMLDDVPNGDLNYYYNLNNMRLYSPFKTFVLRVLMYGCVALVVYIMFFS